MVTGVRNTEYTLRSPGTVSSSCWIARKIELQMTSKEEVKVHFKTILAFVWSALRNSRKSVRISCTGRNYTTETRSSTVVDSSFGPLVSWPTEWLAEKLTNYPSLSSGCLQQDWGHRRSGWIHPLTNYTGSKIMSWPSHLKGTVSNPPPYVCVRFLYQYFGFPLSVHSTITPYSI